MILSLTVQEKSGFSLLKKGNNCCNCCYVHTYPCARLCMSLCVYEYKVSELSLCYADAQCLYHNVYNISLYI